MKAALIKWLAGSVIKEEIEKSSRAFIGTVGERISPKQIETRTTPRIFDAQRGLYVLEPESDYRDLWRTYKSSTWVRACVDLRAKSATSRGWFIEPTKEGASEAERGILEEFFNQPNPENTMHELLKAAFSHEDVFGDAYWEIGWEEGRPKQLGIVDPVGTKIIADSHGSVYGYINATASFEDVFFTPAEMVHFRLGDQIVTEGGRQGLSLYGFSPLESLLLAVEQDIWAQINWRTFLKQGSKERSLYIFADASQAQMKRNREYLDTANRPENAHRDLALEGRNVDWKKIGSSPKDQDLIGLRKMLRDEILAVYAVPPSLLSVIETGNIGAGSGETQQENFREHTIIPLQVHVAQRITQVIIRGAFKITDWRFRFVPPEIVSEMTQAQIDQIYVQAQDSAGESILSAQEVRVKRFGPTLVKAIDKRTIGVPEGRTDVLIKEVRQFQRDLEKVLEEQVKKLADAFSEESAAVIVKAMTDALGKERFAFRFTPVQYGIIEFKKYTWPQFVKQENEFEAALGAINQDEIEAVIEGHYLSIAGERASSLAKKLGVAAVPITGAVREALEGQAAELAKHITDTLGDAARTEVIKAIEAGAPVAEITRRLRAINTTEVTVTPPGRTPFKRQRSFASVSETVAQTDSRRIFNEVGKAQMREAGIEEVKWLGFNNACLICAPFVGKTYPINEVPEGGPPLHHRDRCGLQPVIP